MMSFNRQLEPEKKDKKDVEPDETLDVEKKDIRAMTIAAFLTFLPVLLLFLGALYLIIYLLFLK